jgi:hypothetical protein
LVPEQYGNPLDRHAAQQELSGESIPESVRMTSGYLRKPKELRQSFPPTANNTVQLPGPVPKQMSRRHSRDWRQGSG